MAFWVTATIFFLISLFYFFGKFCFMGFALVFAMVMVMVMALCLSLSLFSSLSIYLCMYRFMYRCEVDEGPSRGGNGGERG